MLIKYQSVMFMVRVQNEFNIEHRVPRIGGPQGMFVGESIVRHIAEYLNIAPAKVSELNLYKEGDITQL